MRQRKTILLVAGLLLISAHIHAQKWFLVGYDNNGNIIKQGGISAEVDIRQDLDCLQSSLGNSASYFAIMRKNGSGVWFNNVYKATFELRGSAPTLLSAPAGDEVTIDVADAYVVVNGCLPGTTINVATADGKSIFCRKATKERTVIDTSTLGKGIYIVHLPGRTLKFCKK